MKQFALLAIVATSLTSVAVQADVYTIDPSHTNVNFSIDHMGATTNRGSFTELSGVVDYNPAAKTGFVGVTIPMATLQTNFTPFTNHLKAKDFFNVANYPSAYFKSTKWYFDGDKPSKIDGELTLLGKTKPVTLTATKFACYDNPILKAKSCGGDFTTTIDRTQWGMDAYAQFADMKHVKLDIQIEAYK